MGTAMDLVFGDGDRVIADGRLVRAADGWWLDSHRVSALTFHRDGRHSDRSSRLLDSNGLIDQFVASTDARRGIRVVGVWRDGTITVETLATLPPDHGRPELWPDDPPCPPPPGGWRTTDPGDELGVGLSALEASGVVVRAEPVRFSGDRLILVVAAGDPAAARAYLEPLLPGRFCVVASRCSRSDLDEVAATFAAHARDWGFEIYSHQSLEPGTGQPYAAAAMFRVCADLAQWADRLPEGLLRLDPSVRPATRPGRRTG